MCVSLMGSITQSGSVGSKAVLVSGGITYTAVEMGTAGNSIKIALVAGGTAGAEVVTVSGLNISVSIESTVSTRNQVVAAIQASSEASALISVSAASGATAASLLASTNLATGTSTAFSQVGLQSVSVAQIDTGLYRISLSDKFKALLNMNVMMISPSAKDIAAQIKSSDVSSEQEIIVRLVAGATPVNMASGDGMQIRIDLRNSSS